MSVTAGLNVDYVVHIAYSFLIQVLVDGFIAKKIELNYKYVHFRRVPASPPGLQPPL